jgi:outer membrane protein OmpA-like peptidoglycan-associated protein
MNTIPHTLKSLAMFATAALMLSACASSPSSPDGAAAVRSKLTQLQGESQLATLAPVEIRDAEDAVRVAETPERDTALSRHRVLLADRKVDIARSWAQSRLYEEQREDLNRQSEQARLDSRTREADLARRDANIAEGQANVARNQAANARGDAADARGDAVAARSQAEIAQGQAAIARNQTNIARGDAAAARNATDAAQDQTAAARAQTGIAQADAANARGQANVARADNAATQRENEELQRQVAELNGRATDRGLVVTLGDVLFNTGQATIQGGNTSNLDKLAVFLKRYPERSVAIEGHTDNVGEDGSNMTLSQNRANAVRSYLVEEGVATSRFMSTGMGESAPVASNDTDTGRQQNRRVEVIIADAR